METNLVKCFDGTSNKFGYHLTNVTKAYAMLLKDDDKQRNYE